MFIINDVLRYDPEKATLEHLNDLLEKTLLTPTQNRMLALFTASGNRVVSKEVILEEVWSKYGLTPSVHNLNTTVSILRKCFLKYGLDGVIETKLKQGFLFNVKVDEFIESPVPVISSGAIVASRASGFSKKVSLLKRSMISHFPLLFLSAGIAALCGSLFFAGTTVNTSQDFLPVKTVHAGKILQCNIEFISSFYRARVKDIDILHLLDISKIDANQFCLTEKNIYYYDNYSLSSTVRWGTRTSYFYSCDESQPASHPFNCVNFYEQEN